MEVKEKGLSQEDFQIIENLIQKLEGEVKGKLKESFPKNLKAHQKYNNKISNSDSIIYMIKKPNHKLSIRSLKSLDTSRFECRLDLKKSKKSVNRSEQKLYLDYYESANGNGDKDAPNKSREYFALNCDKSGEVEKMMYMNHEGDLSAEGKKHREKVKEGVEQVLNLFL